MATKMGLGSGLVRIRNGSRTYLPVILLSLLVGGSCHANVNGQVDGDVTNRGTKLPRLTRALTITTGDDSLGVSSPPKSNNTTRSLEQLENIQKNKLEEIPSIPVVVGAQDARSNSNNTLGKEEKEDMKVVKDTKRVGKILNILRKKKKSWWSSSASSVMVNSTAFHYPWITLPIIWMAGKFSLSSSYRLQSQ